MTLLKVNLEKIPDEKTVPKDEYNLVIKKAEMRESKKGNTMLSLFCNIIDEPDAKMVAHHFIIPKDDDDNKVMYLRRLKEFYQTMGFDLSADIDVEEELTGKDFWAVLDEEESKEYGVQNRIKRFIVPKD